MRLLDRYLLRELLVPLSYCLSGFLLLWAMSLVVTDLGSLQSNQLSALEIVEYYVVLAPGFLVLGVPIALLLALLYALTNHARHHELTAIRAAGVSLWRLCLPYLGVGLMASLAVFALNEFFVPNSDDAAERIRNKHVTPTQGTEGRDKITNFGFNNSRAGRRWQHISVYDLRTGEMSDVLVTQTQADGSNLWLHADRATRVKGVWTFYNAVVRKVLPQTDSIPQVLVRTNVLVQPQFTETPAEIRSEIKIRSMLSIIPTKGLKRPDIPVSEILSYLRLHPHPEQANAIYTKLHGRLAFPWTCLVVVLIAIPFGAPSGRRNVFVGVASSILIFFAYYVLQQICLASGAGGYVSPWLAGWLPNLAFGVAGGFMTARVR
jgi:lipopolysaccharide export system permease protein